jgi:hypothetical protein
LREDGAQVRASALGVEAAKVLLSAGADPSLATPEGKTSLQMARERSHLRLLSMLEVADTKPALRRPRSKRPASRTRA